MNLESLSPSARALSNLNRGSSVDFSDEYKGLPLYDSINHPDGFIAVSGAVNELMVDFTTDYVEKQYSQSHKLSEFLQYGGVTGPPALSEAVSKFINTYFYPCESIEAKNILVTNGVSSALDMVAFNACEAGDGIMCITPMYSMYETDLCGRAQARIVPVSSGGISDLFSENGAVQLLANFCQAYDTATKRGIRVRAVLICNPSNPQGRCYSRKSLIAIAKFCGQRRLHFFSDEIYAMSSFDAVEEDAHLDPFTSVLSLRRDPKNSIYPENIHSLYGVSKDFGFGGLRLGFFITRNMKFWQTCRKTALFTWVTPFSTSLFTQFLSDEALVKNYLTLYRSRLRARYQEISTLLRRHRIPFDPGNAGLFVWLDLSQWLCYYHGSDVPKKALADRESREEQLCRYLARRGVLLSLGEESSSPEAGRFRFVYSGADGCATVAIERIRLALTELERTKNPVSSFALTSKIHQLENEESDMESEIGSFSSRSSKEEQRDFKTHAKQPRLKRLLEGFSCF